MPVNKNALIRYLTLDKCFSNFGRKYFIEDLIEACNIALKEFNGENVSVSKRQIYNDIRFMESEEGYGVELERLNENRRVYYRYKDRNFSITKIPLKENEILLIKDTLGLLQRFKGLPQFDWLNELNEKLNEYLISKDSKTVKNFVQFDNNPYLLGMEHFKPLYNAILYKKVLEISYKSYRRAREHTFVIHPYLLKEYNNRWFLFGYNPALKDITNLALDRITHIKEIPESYIENTVDFDEYFDDIIGVTRYKNESLQEIILEIDESLWPYIKSKPLHPSQAIIKDAKNEERHLIKLELIPNYELESILLSNLDKIKIIKPNNLKIKLLERAKKFIEKNI